ncbi:hypothetical protein HMPREF3016_09270 [Rothia sp. HMSC065D02]|nr:hypothetical protein HMPREF3016_09270 [Rothia sp. HMSC065D02]
MCTIQGQVRMRRDQLQQMSAHLGDNPLVLALGLLCCFRIVQGAGITEQMIRNRLPNRFSLTIISKFFILAYTPIPTNTVRTIIGNIKSKRLISTTFILSEPKIPMMMLPIPSRPLILTTFIIFLRRVQIGIWILSYILLWRLSPTAPLLALRYLLL